MMRAMPAVPSFSSRMSSFVSLGRGRGRRRRMSPSSAMTHKRLDGLVDRVIAAVNARGLCAADVSRLASLPDREVAAMALRCGCRDCFVARAN